ncbi:MAG: hypothetical protein AB8I08_10090 [Sandaracinaceae bacterium]
MHQLVFYLPIVFGAILAFGAALGLLEAMPDLDIDLDMDADMDIDAEVSAELEGEADAEGESSAVGASILTMLGVGKAPLGVLVMCACFLFGTFGLAVDGVLEHVFGSGAGWVVLSASIALVLSGLGTGKMAGFAAKLVPTKETYASSHEQLLGQTGTALHATDGQYGLAAVQDPGGARLEVRVCTYDGETIARGEPLLVADYDEDTRVFLVTRYPS